MGRALFGELRLRAASARSSVVTSLLMRCEIDALYDSMDPNGTELIRRRNQIWAGWLQNTQSWTARDILIGIQEANKIYTAEAKAASKQAHQRSLLEQRVKQRLLPTPTMTVKHVLAHYASPTWFVFLSGQGGGREWWVGGEEK